MKFDYYFSGRIHESLSTINIQPLLLYDSSYLLGQRTIVIPYGSRINKTSLLGEGSGSASNDFLLYNRVEPKYFDDDKKARCRKPCLW